MIFITAKFRVQPEHADRWPEIVNEFTKATRGEPGCLWFDWSRSIEDPTEYVLVEAFRDEEAGGAHVQSEHFANARKTLPPHLAETPRIVNFVVPQDDWSRLGEMAPSRGRAGSAILTGGQSRRVHSAVTEPFEEGDLAPGGVVRRRAHSTDEGGGCRLACRAGPRSECGRCRPREDDSAGSTVAVARC